MSYADRMMKSLLFMFSSYRQSGKQPLKALGSQVVFFMLLGLNVLFLMTLPIDWNHSAFVSGVLTFLLLVCPMFLVWPIVAVAVVRADLNRAEH